MRCLPAFKKAAFPVYSVARGHFFWLKEFNESTLAEISYKKSFKSFVEVDSHKRNTLLVLL